MSHIGFHSLSLSPSLSPTRLVLRLVSISFYKYRSYECLCHTRRREEAAEVVGGPSRCKHVGASSVSMEEGGMTGDQVLREARTGEEDDRR